MSYESISYLSLAILLLLFGHIVRAIRWALLFSPKMVEKRIDLLIALSFGYLINTIIPFRAGELFRVWYVSFKTKIKWDHVFATIIAERFSDLGALILILISLLLFLKNELLINTLIIFTLAFSLILFIAYLINTSLFFRKKIWYVTAIFNEKIQMSILNLCWLTSELILNKGLLNSKFIYSTIAMWLFYLSSFYLFSLSINIEFLQTFSSLFIEPLASNINSFKLEGNENVNALLLFTIIPITIILVYALAKKHKSILGILNKRKRMGWYSSNSQNTVSKNKFADTSEYEFFLSSLFSGDNYATTKFGLNAVNDSTIIRLFNGGSDAITALIEVKNRLIIRKFATQSAAQKLQNQYEWLEKNQLENFPLVSVLERSETDDPFYYDMPLIVPSSDYYDFIHTNEMEASQKILDDVYESIDLYHKKHAKTDIDKNLIKQYFDGKVTQNTRTILDFARKIIPSNHFTINGKEFNFSELELLLDTTWLLNQVNHFETTSIHGDLTIENVIIAPGTEKGWYLIDPNSENIFNSALIDWAKLFQSLHLGYESLNRSHNCSIEGSDITLPLSKSAEYSFLYKNLEHKIQAQYGGDYLKEIYFHELVNYLRLTPYKIRQNHSKGLCFFACTCILFKQYLGK